MTFRLLLAATASAALLASCGGTDAATAQSAAQSDPNPASMAATDARADGMPFTAEVLGDFDEPWASDFMPGTDIIFITEKAGAVKWVDLSNGRLGSIDSGLPEVDYGGQGGLGDIAFAPDWTPGTGPGTLYLSWAEAGADDTRGAVLGRGTLSCGQADACELRGLEVIWRQDKTTGRGHYGHRIAFSPDGQHIFLTSSDRQKFEPAQDLSDNKGSILRLNLDGTPAAGNPFAERGSPADEIWSYGHRNPLGIAFAADGTLWEHEMGPAGGDELNIIVRGDNYGYPRVSNGDHYDGRDIPDHSADNGFNAPEESWTPVISPAGFVIYSGDRYPGWAGTGLIGGLSSKALVRVSLDGQQAGEIERYDMGARIREVEQGPDSYVYLLEDDRGDSQGRLLRLVPRD